MESSKKYKNVCRVDDNGIFTGFMRVYRDPRSGQFLVKPNSLDVDAPDVARIGTGEVRAKWNHDKKEWVYLKIDKKVEQNEQHPEATDSRTHPTASSRYYVMSDEERNQEANQILTYIRNKRLEDTDVLVLRAYETGKAVSKKIQKYREELREIPNKIREGSFSKPSLKSEIFEQGDDVILKTKTTELINFDHWPTPIEEVRHEL